MNLPLVANPTLPKEHRLHESVCRHLTAQLSGSHPSEQSSPGVVGPGSDARIDPTVDRISGFRGLTCKS